MRAVLFEKITIEHLLSDHSLGSKLNGCLKGVGCLIEVKTIGGGRLTGGCLIGVRLYNIVNDNKQMLKTKE